MWVSHYKLEYLTAFGEGDFYGSRNLLKMWIPHNRMHGGAQETQIPSAHQQEGWNCLPTAQEAKGEGASLNIAFPLVWWVCCCTPLKYNTERTLFFPHAKSS